jgi:hypothetical protein
VLLLTAPAGLPVPLPGGAGVAVRPPLQLLGEVADAVRKAGRRGAPSLSLRRAFAGCALAPSFLLLLLLIAARTPLPRQAQPPIPLDMNNTVGALVLPANATAPNALKFSVSRDAEWCGGV